MVLDLPKSFQDDKRKVKTTTYYSDLSCAVYLCTHVCSTLLFHVVSLARMTSRRWNWIPTFDQLLSSQTEYKAALLTQFPHCEGKQVSRFLPSQWAITSRLFLVNDWLAHQSNSVAMTRHLVMFELIIFCNTTKKNERKCLTQLNNILPTKLHTISATFWAKSPHHLEIIYFGRFRVLSIEIKWMDWFYKSSFQSIFLF